MRRVLIGLLVACFPLAVLAAPDDFVYEPGYEPGIIPEGVNDVSTEETVIIEKRRSEHKVSLIDFAISLNQPTYILPYYYTASPYYAVYEGDTPDNQPLNQSEFKFQLSLLVPVWQSVMNTPVDINISYTQMSYWQLYTTSAWFRETDYEPEIIVNYTLNANNQVGVSLNHESNGRGGSEERSWNRLIAEYTYGHNDWMVQLRAWALVLKAGSIDLYNPDIADYLGHGDITASYEINKLVISLQAGNFEKIERAHAMGSLSYPLSNKFRLYVQGFTGYGQSLIEYNHRTNAFGIGIAFNDWLT
jgi:phospholipase A1/A2